MPACNQLCGAICSRTCDGAAPKEDAPGPGALAGATACMEGRAKSSDWSGAGVVTVSVNHDAEAEGASADGALQRGGILATNVAALEGPPIGAIGVAPISARVGSVAATRSGSVATPGSVPGSAAEDGARIRCGCINSEDCRVAADKHALV
jgi:hypothetical protein